MKLVRKAALALALAGMVVASIAPAFADVKYGGNEYYNDIDKAHEAFLAAIADEKKYHDGLAAAKTVTLESPKMSVKVQGIVTAIDAVLTNGKAKLAEDTTKTTPHAKARLEHHTKIHALLKQSEDILATLSKNLAANEAKETATETVAEALKASQARIELATATETKYQSDIKKDGLASVMKMKEIDEKEKTGVKP